MPNWCQNQLDVTGPEEVLRAFKDLAQGEGGALSLQKLIPMPKELEGTTSPVPLSYEVLYHGGWKKLLGQPDGAIAWPDFEGLKTEEEVIQHIRHKYRSWVEEAYKTKRAKDATGYSDWYNWRNQHWGIKWDIEAQLEISDSTLAYTFDSAWAPPIEALDTIAEKFPKLHFDLRFAEGGCDFAGRIKWEDGQKCYQIDGTPRDWEWAREMCGLNEEEDEG